MKEKFVNAYMDVAHRFAQLSSAKRLQVGAIIVKDDRIISIGYNGMPSGWTNECEYEQHTYDSRDIGSDTSWKRDLSKGGYSRIKTKPEVIHAEANAILKLAQSTDSAKDSVLFVTHCPCMECVKMIISCGISAIIYKHEYRFHEQLELLRKCNIRVYNYNSTPDSTLPLKIQDKNIIMNISNVDYSLNKKKWKKDIDIFCKQNQFINLQILSHFENDIVGHVKFIATLSSGDLYETSKFIKINKKWFYENAVLD